MKLWMSSSSTATTGEVGSLGNNLQRNCLQSRYLNGVLIRGIAFGIAMLLIGWSLPAANWAQSPAEPLINQTLQQAREFEEKGQWADALSIYQQALRKSPHDTDLLHKRALARLHFDLAHRYGDSSFLQQVRVTNSELANTTYSEILQKVQSYYVDQPDWHSISRYGLISLNIALSSTEFTNLHCSQKSPEQIQAAWSAVTSALEKVAVQKRADSLWVAQHTAEIMHTQLGLPISATMFEFVSGAIAALDPYSGFMSANQYGETMSQIEGNFVGLGVELKLHAHYLEIVNVIAAGPAGQGGIKIGDRIIAIDGSLVSDVGSEKGADMLRGIEGSTINLVISRHSQNNLAFQLKRRRVEIPSLEQISMIDAESGVGYMKLSNFQKTTGQDLDKALWQLQQQGMRSLIVDVRGNPGGLLTAAVDVANRFIESGVIVSTKGRNPLEDYTHQAQAPGTWRVPLVVLVDENSASASEIFAAAIKDHQRGRIVGHQSYGKGSVQGIFPLNTGSGGLRLTTAKFYSPQGNPIAQVGVSPDVSVASAAKPALGDDMNKPASDPVLTAGVNIAKQEFARFQAALGR